MLSFNGINQSQIAITGGVNMSVTAPNVFFGNNYSSSGDNTVGTVPAGKKWTILNFSIGTVNAATACLSLLKKDATTIGSVYSIGSATVPVMAINNYNSAYSTGIKLASNEVLKINNSAASAVYGSFQIYEEAN